MPLMFFNDAQLDEMRDLITLLERRGLLAHSRFIEKAGSPAERIVTDVAELKGTKVNYLSLLLVKNPGRERGDMQRGCRKKTSTEIEEEETQE